MRSIESLAFLLFFVGGLILTLAHRPWMEWALVHCSYYIILAGILAAGMAFVPKVASVKWGGFFRAHWGGLLLAFVITTIVAVAIEPAFRILSDETNLIGVSKSLFYFKKPAYDLMSRWSFDRYWAIESLIPKRPLLFPFVVQIFHYVFGYSYENAFYANLTIYFFLLFLGYYCVAVWKGPKLGYAVPLFLVAQPILNLSARSAGFDALACLLFFSALFFFVRFLQTKKSEDFLVLWGFLFLLAHSRYESILLFPLLLAVLLLTRSVSWELFIQNRFIAITPLLLLPRIWQGIVTWGRDQTPFGLGFLFEHLTTFFAEIVSWNYYWPYAYPLLCIGLLLLVGGVINGLRFGLPKNAKLPILTILLAVGVQMLVVCSFEGNRFIFGKTSRLYLIPVLFLSLIPVFSYGLFQTVKLRWVYVLAFAAVILYFPVGVQARAFRAFDSIFENKITYEFVRKQNNQRIMLIALRPWEYTPLSIGTISFNYANKHKEVFLNELHDKLYEDIYVVQIVSENGMVEPDYKLDEAFELKPVYKIQTRLEHFLLVSQVKVPNHRVPIPKLDLSSAAKVTN